MLSNKSMIVQFFHKSYIYYFNFVMQFLTPEEQVNNLLWKMNYDFNLALLEKPWCEPVENIFLKMVKKPYCERVEKVFWQLADNQHKKKRSNSQPSVGKSRSLS